MRAPFQYSSAIIGRDPRAGCVSLLVTLAVMLFARQAIAAPPEPIRIVTLGDSITRGVRGGVTAEQTFSALLEARLRNSGIACEVINVGIGGERTDQALIRLGSVLEKKPAIVTIMYGTNDSYVDKGRQESRLTVDAYRANLVRLLADLRKAGVRPILMTEPRWGEAARNGLDENPNTRLEAYVSACREVARETKTPLVDHYADWTTATLAAVDISGWTTDLCHPNPAGHVRLAGAMFPVVRAVLDGSEPLVMHSPTGGEVWSAESQHRIEWDAKRLPADTKLRLEVSTDGGASWVETAREVENSGQLVTTAPSQETADFRIRLGVPALNLATASAAIKIGASQRVANYAWTLVTSKADFAPRDGAGALIFQGHMWFLGGWNPGDKAVFPRICNNEVWSSENGANWTLVKPNTFLNRSFDPLSDWEGRHTAGYAVFQDKLWILGGDANQGNYQPDVWNSVDGKTWNRVSGPDPTPWGQRVLHFTAAFQGKLWVMGGQTMPGFAAAPEVFHRDIWNSDDGKTWTKLAPQEPCWAPRGMVGGTAILHDRFWVLGGGTYDTPTTKFRRFYNDVWSTSDGVTWSKHLDHAPWEPRQYHDVAAYDGRLWVMEGWNQANRNDVWYSADGTNWYELPGTPWVVRHAASVFVHDNALWMVAGNNMQSDVWKLTRKIP